MRPLAIPSLLSLVLSLAASDATAWTMPYTKPTAKYPVATTALDAKLPVYWASWKSRFLRDGLVKASDSGATPRYTSEGQAFGLMLSLWMNDSVAFRSIHEKTVSLFWLESKGQHGSLLDGSGHGLVDSGYSAGAELDIAGALISASALVDSSLWPDATPSYRSRAKSLMSVIRSRIDGNGHVISFPGAGSDALNPSHHAMHWYQTFKEFCATNGISGFDGDKARKAAYDLIVAQPNSKMGMVRNWSTVSGGTSGCGSTCNSLPNNNNMGFDAVRTPWHIGLDAIWHRDPSALAWLKDIWPNGAVNPDKPGMYDVSTATLSSWCESGATNCKPEYDPTFTRAMWGAAAVGASDSSALARSAAATIASHFANNANYDFLGDHAGGVRNDYVTQTMGLLGVLAMTGNVPDVWGDIKHVWIPNDTNTRVTSELTASPDTILVGGKTRLVVEASKPVVWQLRYKPRSSSTWTSIVLNASARSSLDTTLAIKGMLAASYKAGDTLDLQAFWRDGIDTSAIVLHVAATSTSTQERPATRLPGIARLDGSTLVLGSSFDGEAIESVRFLDAKGHTIATSPARPVAGGIALQQLPAQRGLLFFEIRTGTRRIQGRLIRL